MMSHWDFGRPTGGQHDTQGPADPGYPPDDAWPSQDEDEWPAPDGSQPEPGWPAPDGWPGDEAAAGQWTGGGAAGDPWAANRRRPAEERWSPGGGRPAAEGWPPDDDWDEDDDDTAPYPLTYERDDFTALGPEPAAPPPQVPWEPWPPAPYPDTAGAPEPPDALAAAAGAGAPGGAASGSWPDDDAGQAGNGRRRGAARRERRRARAAATGWPEAEPGLPAEAVPDWASLGRSRRAGRDHGNRRWLILAGLAVTGAAVGAAAVLIGGGHPRGQAAAGSGRPTAAPARAAGTPSAPGPSASASPAAAAPLTLAQAEGVLAGYTTVNNSANAERSEAMLATIETGSSYAIDAALYQMQGAAGTAPYPAFAPAQATYFIPAGEPATGPRWFVVQVGNAFSSAPKKVTSTEYLLFTQSAPGAAWQNAVEPYILSGASAPRIALGADGLATAVSPGATGVAVAPGQLPSATAASLDGTGAGQAAIANPGNLADLTDQQAWQGKLPGGKVTDTHAPASGADGQEFAVATTDGGALVFYTDAADVTLTPPAGSGLKLTIPGFYSAGQSLSRAGVSYLEQFAAYDPPAGGGAPRIVADYSGITGKD
jgi:hypothetical protein